MLKKEYRLKTQDFKTLPKTSKYYTDNFTIRVDLQNGKSGRFAVVAPKKLYKLAVLRNKAKRLAYTSLKGMERGLVGVDKVFIFINKDILALTTGQIVNELKQALKTHIKQ